MTSTRRPTDPDRADRGRCRRERPAARRRPQGARRVRVLLRPLDGRHAVGRHPAQPPSPRPDHRHPHRPLPLAVPGVFAVLTHEDVPGVKRYGLEHRDQPVLARDRVRYQGEAVAMVAADHPRPPAGPRRSSRSTTRCCRRHRPAGGGSEARARRSTRRQHRAPRAGSATATRRSRPPWSSPASTRSACRTRRSWGRSRGSPCPPWTAGSTSTSPRSGCTSTGVRSPTPWVSTKTSSGSRWPASAVRSERGRTCRSRCTRACWRCAPGGRSRWCTPGRSRSSDTSTGIRPGCATSTAPTRTAVWSTCAPRSCSTEAPTLRARPRSWPTPRPWARDRTTYLTSRSTLRGLHQQPSLRRDARLRRGPGRVRVRVADGPAGRGPRARPGGGPGAQRAGRG